MLEIYSLKVARNLKTWWWLTQSLIPARGIAYRSEGNQARQEREQNCFTDDLVRGMMHPGASAARAKYICLFMYIKKNSIPKRQVFFGRAIHGEPTD